MSKTFAVTLTVTQEHTYEVEANTSEEAESVAEVLFDEGEEGAVVHLSTDATDTYPVESNEN